MTASQRHLRLPGRSLRGFTLIEVLVALAVIAIALATLMAGSARTTSNAIHLQDGTYAQWVAENRMAEIRMEQSWPSEGTTEGTEEQGGREWHWTQEVEETPDPSLRRVDIAVRADEDDEHTVATLSGFVGAPQQLMDPPFLAPYDMDEGARSGRSRGRGR